MKIEALFDGKIFFSSPRKSDRTFLSNLFVKYERGAVKYERGATYLSKLFVKYVRGAT